LLDKIFDSYGRKARLQPALLVLFPLILVIATGFQDLYSLGAGLLGLIASSGFLYLLANLAASKGRKLEPKLFAKWGGAPTTTWLRYSDDNLDKLTKERYFYFLERNIVKWEAPTEEMEISDVESYDQRCVSAVRWLREHSRGDSVHSKLVHKENIAYGFRRNLFGLKGVGITTTVLALLLGVGVLYSSGQTDIPVISAIGICLFMLFFWVKVVSDNWVYEAGNCYARALLSFCDRNE